MALGEEEEEGGELGIRRDERERGKDAARIEERRRRGGTHRSLLFILLSRSGEMVPEEIPLLSSVRSDLETLKRRDLILSL